MMPNDHRPFSKISSSPSAPPHVGSRPLCRTTGARWSLNVGDHAWDNRCTREVSDCMPEVSSPIDRTLERYRQYLALIARLQLDPQWAGKVDLSGVVQQTLFEAHVDQGQFKGDESGARLAWLRR